MDGQGAIKVARNDYRCNGGPYNVCNRTIRPGDTYFSFTHRKGDRFFSNKYCLECAQRYHGDLLPAAMRIKQPAKQKTARATLARMKYAGQKANQFRRALTPSEQFLWEYLGGKKLGAAFQRQFQLHGYVVDFWCAEHQLVIELDGAGHRMRKQKDAQRDEVLQHHGIRVLRFPSGLVYADINFILERIRNVIAQRSKS